MASQALLGTHTLGYCILIYPLYPCIPSISLYTLYSSSYTLSTVPSLFLYIGLVAQSLTMIERGQQRVAIEHMYFYVCMLFLVALHISIMAARAYMRQCGGTGTGTSENSNSVSGRGSFCHDYNDMDTYMATYTYNHSYQELDWLVWLFMCALPVIGAMLALALNSYDNQWYRRHLQFLRLEFDTRLGMHSPR